MLKRNSIILLWCLSFVLFFSTNGFCNDYRFIDGYSVNPKLGVFGDSRENEGAAIGVELNFLKKNNIFSLVYFGCAEFTILESTPEENNQINLMIGKFKGYKKFKFHGQTGAGIVWGEKRGALIEEEPDSTFSLFDSETHKKEKYATAGLPVKIGVGYEPSVYFSVGLDFLSNFNVECSTYIAMLSVNIGHF